MGICDSFRTGTPELHENTLKFTAAQTFPQQRYIVVYNKTAGPAAGFARRHHEWGEEPPLAPHAGASREREQSSRGPEPLLLQHGGAAVISRGGALIPVADLPRAGALLYEVLAVLAKGEPRPFSPERVGSGFPQPNGSTFHHCPV